MNILRTLENQRKILRIIRHFCDSFSWETQSVKVWWNLNLLEKHVKKKIIQQWFTNSCLFFLELNNVSKLSFNHHLFLVFQKHKLILQMSSSCKDFLHLLVSIQQLMKNAIMFCLYFFHFIIKKVRLHLRLRCIHLMQWLNSLSTWHFFWKRLQCSQERMTARSEFIRSRRSLHRKLKFFVVQWKDMKVKWFSRWKS